MIERIPTLGISSQNCECGGVPVLDRIEPPYAVFVCSLCKAEYKAPAPRQFLAK